MPADELRIFLCEFLVHSARGLRRRILCGPPFGELAAAEIVLGLVIEHWGSSTRNGECNCRHSQLNSA